MSLGYNTLAGDERNEIPVVTIAPYAETRDVIKHSRSTDDDSYADVTIKPTNSQVLMVRKKEINPEC